MKILNLTTAVILIFSSIYSQENKDDWPNLNRYQSDNETIKNIKNTINSHNLLSFIGLLSLKIFILIPSDLFLGE